MIRKAPYMHLAPSTTPLAGSVPLYIKAITRSAMFQTMRQHRAITIAGGACGVSKVWGWAGI